jgi:hypothetical protein
MARHALPFALAALAATIAALAFSLAGNAGAERTLTSTLNYYDEEFTTRIGDVNNGVATCKAGEKAIGGGYLVLSGNYVYVVGAFVPSNHRSYAVIAFVPNAVHSTGVEPATIRVKVICADAGKPIVP